MQVETYEVEEISGGLGIMAADSEALELIDKLGLGGQRKLSDLKTATRQPYRQLTQLERNVADVLFPIHTTLEDYSQGLIPLRVLQVAAHAKDVNLFSRLEVWHPASRREKDPLLIGVTKHPEYSWQEAFFLLARWGDAMPTWDELAEKAQKLWLARARPQLLALKTRLDMEVETLEGKAAIAFTGGPMPELNYDVKVEFKE